MFGSPPLHTAVREPAWYDMDEHREVHDIKGILYTNCQGVANAVDENAVR